MSSWYGRNSLMPSQSRQATISINNLAKKQMIENRSKATLKSCVVSSDPKETNAPSDVLNQSTAGSTSNDYVLNQKGAGARVSRQGIPFSQVSDLTMTQEATSQAPFRDGIERDECTLQRTDKGQPSFDLSHCRSFASNPISTSLSEQSSTITQSESSVASQPSNCLQPSISRLFHKNTALLWRPGIRTSQRLQVTKGNSSEIERMNTDLVQRSRASGPRNQHQKSMQGDCISTSSQSSRCQSTALISCFPESSRSEFERSKGKLHINPLFCEERNVPSKNRREAYPTSALEGHTCLREDKKGLSRENHRVVVDESSQLVDLLSKCTDVRFHLHSSLNTLSEKESELSSKLADLAEREHSFHLRLQSAEDDHKRRMHDIVGLQEKNENAIVDIASKKLNHYEVTARESETVLNNTMAKILDVEVKQNNRIREMEEKLSMIESTIVASDQNHRAHMKDLASSKAHIDSKYSRVSKLLSKAEKSVSTFTSLVERSLESIEGARSTFVESSIPLLATPVSKIVKGLFNTLLATMPRDSTCATVPHITPDSKVEVYESLDPICKADVDCSYTPKREQKKSAKALPSSPIRHIRSRKCKQTPHMSDTKLPSRKRSKLDSVSFIATQIPSITRRSEITQILSPCTTVCDQVCSSVAQTSASDYLVRKGGFPCKNADIIQSEQTQRNPTPQRNTRRIRVQRGKFGSVKGRMNVFDDEFSFL